ncbi:MAG: acetolactate decarboxylase [bacterium]
MTRRLFLLTLFFLLAAFSAVSFSQDGITQISTFHALAAGDYNGRISCQKLLEHGDFGLGTFEGLDGEMIVSEGKIYQVKADGRVLQPTPSLQVPFAEVAFFKAQKSEPLKKEMGLKDLKEWINQTVPDQNTFCAVRVKGHFAQIKVRSVPAQQKPYPSLAEAVKHQTVFELSDISGVLIGFRSPDTKGETIPGCHFHFLSDDQQHGGHVLDFTMSEGNVEFENFEPEGFSILSFSTGKL